MRRADNRQATSELRPLAAKLGVVPSLMGSAELSQGLTSVIATVNGPREPRRQHQQRATSACVEVRVYPASGHPGSAEHYVQLSLTECLSRAVEGSLIAGSLVSIFVQVVRDDGGLLGCCLNAAVLALLHSGIPMKTTPVATSIGLQSTAHDATGQIVRLDSPALLVDPCGAEYRHCTDVVTIVFTARRNEVLQVLPDKGAGLTEADWNKAFATLADATAVVAAFFRATVEKCVMSVPLPAVESDSDN